MSPTKSIAVVITSNRGLRIGPAVASVISRIISPALTSKDNNNAKNITLTTVDLKSFNLPVFADPLPPKLLSVKSNSNSNGTGTGTASAQHPAGLAWTTEITRHDGYIFVIPEYNYGMSGATKNAIDYLYHGFVGKPVMVVSYGGQGGKLANEQVRGVLGGMGLKVVDKKVELAWPAPAGWQGGIVPDAKKAVFEGKLGEDSEVDWVETRAGDVLEAFGELRGSLSEEDVVKAN